MLNSISLLSITIFIVIKHVRPAIFKIIDIFVMAHFWKWHSMMLLWTQRKVATELQWGQLVYLLIRPVWRNSFKTPCLTSTIAVYTSSMFLTSFVAAQFGLTAEKHKEMTSWCTNLAHSLTRKQLLTVASRLQCFYCQQSHLLINGF